MRSTAVARGLTSAVRMTVEPDCNRVIVGGRTRQPGTREEPHTGDRIIVWLGDRVELDLEAERLGDLHDRRETGVAVGRERLVQTLAAHPDLAGKLAEVLRAGDVAECLSHERRVIA